jgi:hypothetical protein
VDKRVAKVREKLGVMVPERLEARHIMVRDLARGGELLLSQGLDNDEGEFGRERRFRNGALVPMRSPATTMGQSRVQLRRLFYGHRPAAVAFQAGLIAIDFAAIAYFVATSFVADSTSLRLVDLLLGALLARGPARTRVSGANVRSPPPDGPPR